MNQRPDADDLPHTEWKCDNCGFTNSMHDGDCQRCTVTVWEVWLCGPTDCFWHATFGDKAKAEAWAIASNPGEGYMLKKQVIVDPNYEP